MFDLVAPAREQFRNLESVALRDAPFRTEEAQRRRKRVETARQEVAGAFEKRCVTPSPIFIFQKDVPQLR